MAPLLEIENLHTRFDTPDGQVFAVNGVDFSISDGETVGLVGNPGLERASCFSVPWACFPPTEPRPALCVCMATKFWGCPRRNSIAFAAAMFP